MEPKDEVVVTEPEVEIPAQEEADLDASIEATISQVRAENGGETITPAAKESTETPSAEVVVPPKEGEAPKPEEQPQDAIDLTNPPTKGKFESEESYTMRVNLFDLIKQRKAAGTQSEKDAIQSQMQALRTEIGELSRKSKPPLPNNNDGTPPNDSQEKIDPVDIDKIVDERLQARQQAIEIKSVADSFFEKHAVFKDPDVREVFLQFFDSNYKIEGKSAKEVGVVLDLARQAMFRPNESVQERVLAAAKVGDKVNAMQFPGGTIVKPALTPEQQKSIDEIVATGMSEAKARELILD